MACSCAVKSPLGTPAHCYRESVRLRPRPDHDAVAVRPCLSIIVTTTSKDHHASPSMMNPAGAALQPFSPNVPPAIKVSAGGYGPGAQVSSGGLVMLEGGIHFAWLPGLIRPIGVHTLIMQHHLAHPCAPPDH